MAIGDIFSSFSFGGGGMISLFIYMFLGIFIMGGLALFFFLLYRNKKKWFLKVVFLIPRSDGTIIQGEIGKGSYDARRGVVLIKRRKKKATAMKPFDVKRFLLGSELLTVVQVGIEDYRPVLQESYLEMVDDETGEEAAIMKTKIDTSESKSWKQSFERETKNAYSIQTLLQQYAQFIGFGILFFMIFVGFAILWSRVR